MMAHNIIDFQTGLGHLKKEVEFTQVQKLLTHRMKAR